MALRDWYADREVLLTGATSELGRTLLEKILRCFPTTRVYLLVRSRQGLGKDERIEKILESARYDRLRQQDPRAMSRLTVLEGNLLYEDLGLGKEDKAAVRNVTVVFHAGGPHDEVFEFCRELPRLVAIAAASSIFKCKGRIAEASRNERAPEIPLALVRLALLGPAHREPTAGYVDTLKGSTALMVGAGFALGDSKLRAEVIPVDLAVNTLLAAAWERSTLAETRGAVVYNAPSIECTWGELLRQGKRAGRKFPYPSFGIRGMTSIVALHCILIALLEWLPSALCDYALGLCCAKPRMVAEYERVRNALRPLESISSRPWPGERNRVRSLHERLSPEEQDAFPVIGEIDIESYVLCAAAASKKYCAGTSNGRIVDVFRSLLLLIAILALVCAIYSAYRLNL
ncbi:hypothetical protein KM043_004829 [Ampulex compressa]|nr:hypothetical protein KM043_004829 [Ampulex compressa]